jgi:hypothetical protein
MIENKYALFLCFTELSCNAVWPGGRCDVNERPGNERITGHPYSNTVLTKILSIKLKNIHDLLCWMNVTTYIMA